jgi:phosphate transport system substrate-binding protein
MAMRKGKCTNFKNCEVADHSRIVELPDTADFNCPTCSRPLSAIQTGKRDTLPLILVGLAILIVALLAWRMVSHRSAGGTAPVTASVPVLRLHGSNTIGAQLVPALAEAFLKAQGATDVRKVSIGGDEMMVQGVMAGSSSAEAIEIHAHGSATAFQDLGVDKCDIGMASRRINAAEIQALAALGNMTSPACEHVLGLDGIAIIVNRGNTVPSLTKDRLAKIFMGEITDWNEVQGPAGPIQIYARDDKSGTYDTFKTLVLGSGKLPPAAKRFEDSRALSDAVAADGGGIGFVGLPYVASAKAVPVGDTGVDPLLPTRMTVATEDYLLSRRLYLYTPANAKNSLTRKFVEFALSKTGQDVVAAEGFVSQNVVPDQVSVDPKAPRAYKNMTAGAERLTLDFRFRTGSADLDNKALADLDRTISLLSDLKYTGDNVMLLGFADSTGTMEKNQTLSEQRAKAVADQFVPRGLRVRMVNGFGQAMPVASNDTDDGRQKNRRVEMWLKK